MSKESIKASIETKKGRLAEHKNKIAAIRARKAASKDKSYKKNCDDSIANEQRCVAQIQREIASLREQLKTAK